MQTLQGEGPLDGDDGVDVKGKALKDRRDDKKSSSFGNAQLAIAFS